MDRDEIITFAEWLQEQIGFRDAIMEFKQNRSLWREYMNMWFGGSFAIFH
jgi:hypothetical protein